MLSIAFPFSLFIEGRKKHMYIIRRAEKNDIPSIMKLLIQVNMVHHEGRPDLFKGPTTKYTEAELSDLLENEATPIFVCADDKQVLGHGFCIFQHSGGRLMEEHDTLYIDDICVDENHRGKGIGKALFEAIVSFAKSKGCYNVTLNVWSCNPGAMEFYERMGMKPYRTGMETILK